jgi:flagellar basal body-associated protein FliL
MEPARIRDDVDPNSRKYRKELIIVVMIVLGLSIFGGTCLGYKIRTAENQEAAAQQNNKQNNKQNKQEQSEQPTKTEQPTRRVR